MVGIFPATYLLPAGFISPISWGYGQILNQYQRTINPSGTFTLCAIDLCPCFIRVGTHCRSSIQHGQSIQHNFWYLRESSFPSYESGLGPLLKCAGKWHSPSLTLFTFPWGLSSLTHLLRSGLSKKLSPFFLFLFGSPCQRMGVVLLTSCLIGGHQEGVRAHLLPESALKT